MKGVERGGGGGGRTANLGELRKARRGDTCEAKSDEGQTEGGEVEIVPNHRRPFPRDAAASAAVAPAFYEIP